MPSLFSPRARAAAALGAAVVVSLSALVASATGLVTPAAPVRQVPLPEAPAPRLARPAAVALPAPEIISEAVVAPVVAPTAPDRPGAVAPVAPDAVRPPALVATLTAAPAAAGDTEANPGDVLRYLLTLANGGTEDALDVAFSSTLDANTTLVAGSVRVSPLAAPDAITGAVSGTTFTLAAPGVLANDARGVPAATVVSFGGGTLSGNETTTPAGTAATFGTGGSLRVNADGSLSLTTPAGFSGAFTFRYRLANSAGGDAETATIAVAIPPTAANDAPAANSAPGSAFHTPYNTPFALAAPGVLANDAVGAPAATVTSFGGGSAGGTVTTNAAGSTVAVGTGGQLSVAADGAVAFTPSTGFTGLFTFSYRIANVAGTSDATVTIAVGTRPAVATDTYTPVLVGNVPINTATSTGFSVLANDAGSAPVVTLTGTPSGGAVVLAANGTFAFTPNAGYNGPASFTYTLTNGFGTTAPATVSLTVGTPVFFVDVTAAASGDGRRGTPFNCLTGTGCLSVATTDEAGDRVYVASGAYTGGLTLLANQVVVGQGATGASFASVAGLSWPADAGAQPAIGGTAPTITTTAAATNGINLASGNALYGLTFGNATGAAVFGSAFGTLTVGDLRIATTGQALNLATGTLAGSFAQVQSAGGTTNVSLSGVSTTGTVVLGTSADVLSGATGDAVRITGGAGSVTVPSTITNTATFAVNVSGTTGGTLTFSGPINPTTAARGITVSGTSNTAVDFTGSAQRIGVGSAGGVTLTNNTGSTIRFSGGALTVATTTGAAFTATGGGTVSVTGAANTLSATIGRTLNVANTTIGTGGLVFQSITSTGGDSGIILNATGTVAGLTVTGTGTTAGSGGTILTQTGNAVTLTSTSAPSLRYMNLGTGSAVGTAPNATNQVAGAGILMSGVTNAVFRDLRIAQTGSHGIGGTGVSGLTVSDTQILNAGDGSDESALDFASGAANLTGTVALTNVTADGAAAWGLRVRNTSGSLALTVSGGRYANTRNGGLASDAGADGIQLSAAGTAQITAGVANAVFADLESDGIQGVTSGTTGAVLNLTVTGSTFTGYRTGAPIPAVPPGNASSDNAVELNATGTTTLRYTLSGNTMTASENQAILLSGNDASTVDGRIVNNVIDGTASAYGIEGTTLADETASVRLLVDGNTVRNTQLEAMAFNSNLTSTLNLTVTNNSVPTRPRDVVNTFENIQSRALGTSSMCWNVRSNTVAAGGDATGTTSGGIRLFRPSSNTVQPRLEAPSGGATPLAALEAANPAATRPLFATSTTALVAAGTCTQPAVTPLAPEAPVARVPEPVAPAPVAAPVVEAAPVFEPEPAPPVASVPEGAPDEAGPGMFAPASPVVAEPAVAETAAPAQASAEAQATDKTDAALLAGETVTVSVGRLAAGKTVRIFYDATLATPFPVGYAATATGSVTASNAPTIALSRTVPVVQTATASRTFAGTPAVGDDRGWRLLAAPVGGVTVATLATQNLVQGIPGYYPTYQPNIYVGYNGTGYEPPAGGSTVLASGNGFFWQFYDRVITPAGGPSNSVQLPFTLSATGPATSGPVTVPLVPNRYNLLGNPFTLPLDVSGIGTWATGGTLESNVGQLFDGMTYVPTTATGNRVGVWQGMFVEVGTATALVIPPTAQVTATTLDGDAPAATAEAAPMLGFELRGTEAATGLPTLDRAAVFYFTDDATPAWDAWDAVKLTPPASAYALVGIEGARDGERLLMAQDARPLGLSSAFDASLDIVAQGTAGPLVLSWPLMSGLPDAWGLTLRDTQMGTTVDLRQATSYAFDAPAPRPAVERPDAGPLARPGTARFVLTVGPRATGTDDPQGVPSAFALSEASPNPVRDAARVRVDVPRAAVLTVEVYDVLGRLATTLADGPVAAGRHDLTWQTAGLPSGVYLVRMRATSPSGEAFTQTRRLTVAR